MKNKLTSLLCISLIPLALSCSSQRQPGSRLDTTVKAATTQAGSIYDVNLNLENQNGQVVAWQSLHGKIRVIAMVYTHCPAACPIITQQIKAAESKVLASGLGRVQYTLISFDDVRDTAGRLREFYQEQDLDTNWVLLHAAKGDVRTIAALLNVQYKEWHGSDFTHSDVTFGQAI